MTSLLTLSLALLAACDTEPTAARTSALSTLRAPSGGMPELPRAQVDVTMPAVTGRTIEVAPGADLQAALDAAKPGDQVVVAAGATFTGPFVLRNKTGRGWITVRSAGTLPAPGTRVTPAHAAQMPKLLARDTRPVISTEPGAHHWRLVGLEVTAPPSLTFTYALMSLGDGSGAQKTLASQPTHLVFDRMYVHGHPTLDFRRCIQLNSAMTAIVDSRISECHGRGFDSQAILGWTGTGPYRIENNYLEGAGENVMFGGADPSIPNQLPSDIVIRRNHFYKPREWDGVWTVKNSFELKMGQRILVEDNVFENSYGPLQDGMLVVMKTVNQGGTAPWTTTSDVTFRYNVLKGGWIGFGLAGLPEASKGGIPMHRLLFEHNLVLEIADRGGYPDQGGMAFRIGGVADLTIRRNTLYGRNYSFGFGSTGSDRLSITDNIMHGFPVSQDGKGWWNEGAQAYHAPGAVLAYNLIIMPAYAQSHFNPTQNKFAVSVDEVGFVDAASDWRLTPSSPFVGTATAGANPGANLDELARRTRDVVMR